MKILVHTSYFASALIEIDTDTRETRVVVEPSIQPDQACFTDDGTKPLPAQMMEAGGLAIAVLNNRVSRWIIDKVFGEKEKVETQEPILLTNVLGGTGKASA